MNLFLFACVGILLALFASYFYIKHPKEPPKEPEPEPLPEPLPESHTEELLWDTPKNAWHSVRVLCDRLGISYQEKNIICTCIYQESRFSNAAIGRNPKSTDWGICQINDFYQVGPGKPFSSVEDIVNNPEKAVKFMIAMYIAGKLNLWVSYSSGAYKQWLPVTSAMWKLATFT